MTHTAQRITPNRPHLHGLKVWQNLTYPLDSLCWAFNAVAKPSQAKPSQAKPSQAKPSQAIF
jgi:hypothetical protein